MQLNAVDTPAMHEISESVRCGNQTGYTLFKKNDVSRFSGDVRHFSFMYESEFDKKWHPPVLQEEFRGMRDSEKRAENRFESSNSESCFSTGSRVSAFSCPLSGARKNSRGQASRRPAPERAGSGEKSVSCSWPLGSASVKWA